VLDRARWLPSHAVLSVQELHLKDAAAGRAMSLLGVEEQPVEVIAAASLEPATVAVWFIRILFPCLLFWLSYGNCSCAWAPWYSRTRHLRETLLQQRAAVLIAERKKPVPEEMVTLRLVDEITAPLLFQDQKKEVRGDRGQRADGVKDKERERRESKRERRKEQKEKTEKPRVPWEIQSEDGASSSTARAPVKEAVEQMPGPEDGARSRCFSRVWSILLHSIAGTRCLSSSRRKIAFHLHRHGHDQAM